MANYLISCWDIAITNHILYTPIAKVAIIIILLLLYMGYIIIIIIPQLPSLMHWLALDWCVVPAHEGSIICFG